MHRIRLEQRLERWLPVLAGPRWSVRTVRGVSRTWRIVNECLLIVEPCLESCKKVESSRVCAAPASLTSHVGRDPRKGQGEIPGALAPIPYLIPGCYHHPPPPATPPTNASYTPHVSACDAARCARRAGAPTYRAAHPPVRYTSASAAAAPRRFSFCVRSTCCVLTTSAGCVRSVAHNAAAAPEAADWTAGGSPATSAVPRSDRSSSRLSPE
eukprot:81080-Prymnesium_polylepis.2